ncbi:hypothetical protein MKW92_032046 [Papaver armeniacum]|nr:hypothetical protein MKW92_032046 [Papaver armeniacum]
MAKAYLSLLLLGFFSVLMASSEEISEKGSCTSFTYVRVKNCETTKNSCDETCRARGYKGPGRCTAVTYENLRVYDCECCACKPKIAVDTNSCKNPHNCVEACIVQANLYGPSECKEGYDESGKYVHKCYCCERQDLTVGNILAVA